MGRKEAHCLETLAHASMANQTIKVQPGLRKRNSLDSIDFLRQQTHRRNKLQQVRFKEDGTNKTQTDIHRLEAEPVNGTSVVIGKTLMPRLHNLSTCSISFPRSKRALRNIAIQTSPSLRKHFPTFRKEVVLTSKSLKEVPLEPKGCFQVNGNLCEQDSMSSELPHLRTAKHIDDTAKPTKKAGKLKRRMPKGPVHICSELSKFLTLEKNTLSAEISNSSQPNLPQKAEDSISAMEPSVDSNSVHPSLCTKQSRKKDVGRCNASHCNPTLMQCESIHTNKNGTENYLQKKDSKIKRTMPSIRLSHKGSPQCFHRDQLQPEKSIQQPDDMTVNIDDPGSMLHAGNKKHQTSGHTSKCAPQCQTVKEKVSKVPSENLHLKNCEGGCPINSCLPRNKSNLYAGKKVTEINQMHRAPSELGSLQCKLKSIEESLNSNQEKIKVLLNVIEDLERSRALSEGRNSYHTGQDLSNCSTCQTTACIIYSVEYDFRQQEGRFHPVLKTLERVEQRHVSAPVHKAEPEKPTPEKKDLQRKTKKVKKKCFWWI